jgi:O-antigen ligase
MTKINENNNKLYWVYIVGFFIILALPIVSFSPWLAPPAWIQSVLFRSILAVLLFIFLARDKVSFQKIKDGLNPHSQIFIPLISLLAYSITVFISTLTSLDVSFSLWGSPERGAGFINFAFFICFCLFTFITIKHREWRKLLDFSLIIGFLVGFVAILQQSMIFKDVINSSSFRPASTLGNTIILALYLLPSFFIALSFLVSEKLRARKYLYLFLAIFFAFTIIFISQTRAAILGLFVGGFWFLIAYPLPADGQAKNLKRLKISALVSSVIFVVFLFILSGNPQVYEKWPNFIKEPTSRITSITKGFSADQSRMSAWKISLKAALEKPYFGYGPENFYIGFNKHYDFNLPVMDIEKTFDRAHNYLIQILVDSGIFALIFYLIFYLSIIWKLQKIKEKHPIANGLQTGFIALFIASLTSVDGYAINIIFFFLSAYSLYLIASNSTEEIKNIPIKESKFKFLKKPATFILFLLLIIFIWQYNLVPLEMNKQINVAQDLAKDNWPSAYKILDEQSKIKTFFLPFTNHIYLDLLIDRIIAHPDENIALSEKVAEIAEDNTSLQPYDYGNWLRFGEALETINKDKQDPLITKKVDEALKKATELRPNDPTIMYTFFMNDIFNKNFSSAKQKADYCLSKFPNSNQCLWTNGLINIYLNNIVVGKNFIEKAKIKGYETESENSLNRLAGAYIEVKNYSEVLAVYQKLVLKSSNVDYKTSLILAYKLVGQYDKSRQLAMEVMKTNPELKPTLENFLQSF